DWNYVEFSYYLSKSSSFVSLILLSQIGVAWYNPGINLKEQYGNKQIGLYVNDTIRMDVRDINRWAYIGVLIPGQVSMHLTSMALVK
ncbi:MAG: hypothetical protein RR047_03300, partial [Bacilli bacterium]